TCDWGPSILEFPNKLHYLYNELRKKCQENSPCSEECAQYFSNIIMNFKWEMLKNFL
ncbi:hypothetical protein BgiBS90_016181, partial [Biomphalaria glabrata]